MGSKVRWHDCTEQSRRTVRDVKVAASGLYDVTEHMKSNLHTANVKCHEEGATVKAFSSRDRTVATLVTR